MQFVQTDQKQITQKIILFEDIDQVFYDESEFHGQLLKLIAVAKVPIILTMGDNDSLKEMLKRELNESGTPHDYVKYRYYKVKKSHFSLMLRSIYAFEGIISKMI
jgi:hypothetical protein